MDFTPILTALITGASAAAQGVANQAVTSLYQKAKNLLQTKFQNEALDLVEQQPDSEIVVSTFCETLKKSDAPKDTELQNITKELNNEIANLTANNEELAVSLTSPLPVILNSEEKAKALASLPFGPAVEQGIISKDELANSIANSLSAPKTMGFIDRVNNLRIAANHEKFPSPAICIDTNGLSNPEFGGVYSYCYEAIDEAVKRGPRMAAALLLELPLNAWFEVGRGNYVKLSSRYSK